MTNMLHVLGSFVKSSVTREAVSYSKPKFDAWWAEVAAELPGFVLFMIVP